MLIAWVSMSLDKPGKEQSMFKIAVAVAAVAVGIFGINATSKFVKKRIDEARAALDSETTPKERVQELRALLRRQARVLGQAELRLKALNESIGTDGGKSELTALRDSTQRYVTELTTRHEVQSKKLAEIEAQIWLLEIRQSINGAAGTDVGDLSADIAASLRRMSDELFISNREMDLVPSGV